jgi:hypothetical protein
VWAAWQTALEAAGLRERAMSRENVEAIALGGASGLTVRAFARLDHA